MISISNKSLNASMNSGGPSGGHADQVRRILFVDDEPQVRHLFSRQLERYGYSVDLAESPSEALALAADHEYGAVATDMRMPEMDGVELIARLQDQRPGTATVLISGDRSLELPDDGWIDRTLVSVIPKPWNLTELLAAVTRAQQITSQHAAALAAEADVDFRLLLLSQGSTTRQLVSRSLEAEGASVDLRVAKTVSELLEACSESEWQALLLSASHPELDDPACRAAIGRMAAPRILIQNSAAGPSDFPASDSLTVEELADATLLRVLRYAVERQKTQSRLEELKYRDGLTGLGNRDHFRARLKHTLARSRKRREQLAVIFLDVDRFKEINDGWGHFAGDAVLIEMAERLEETFAGCAALARHGGDEFALLLENIDGAAEAEEAAARICKILSLPFHVAGERIESFASVGVSLFPEHGDTEEKLLRLAEKAVYQAKVKGGRSYQFYEGTDVPEPARFLVERELREALERREFVLHYQPQLDLATGRFSAMEALIRWQRPDGEMVPPGRFIPSLEETGQIRDVGAWVVDRSCRQLAEWRDLGFDDLSMCFNVSPRQFEDGRFPHLVRAALERYELAPQRLEVEVTEEVTIRDVAGSRGQLESLRRMGVAVAIDDFGTGYSSLAYLHRFPLDVLKMDRSFIGEIEESPDSRTLVELIITLAHKMHLEVVAEGVETAQQLKFLRREGCDRSQGFFHSRPVPANEIVRLLSDSRLSAAG
ncbi:MAG: EAL domain-containing protein [Acidobacteriota bacterium]